MAPEDTEQAVEAAAREMVAREAADGREGDAEATKAAAARLARLRRAAARVDRNPRWIATARKLRRHMPGDPRFGDPLSTAGQAPVEVIARGVTTLSADESLAKEVGLGALQLWQSLSEATGRGRGDYELALLFTDLVGFSSWALEAGDAVALELLREVGLASEEAIISRGGRIVKRLGDGLMATFLDAQSAVEAALEAQAAVARIELAGHRPRMRAGVHWGRPRRLGGDYLGVDVNIAARVVDAAKGEQLLVSTPVLDQLDTAALRTGRPKRLKADGAPRELQVVEITR